MKNILNQMQTELSGKNGVKNDLVTFVFSYLFKQTVCNNQKADECKIILIYLIKIYQNNI